MDLNPEEPVQEDEAMQKPKESVEDQRNTITDKELSECDREDLSHIGLVQGGCGHVLFIKASSGEIIGHDSDIHQVDFISHDSASLKSSTLIGSLLIDCVPGELHKTILECILQMRMALSHRTFYFYAVSGKTFALSISSIEADYSIVGIEIEISTDSQEVRILKRQQ